MNEKVFKKFLNIILIIGTIGIVILLGIWIYQEYEQYRIEKDAEVAILEFEEEFINDVNIVDLEDEIPMQEQVIEEEIIEGQR